MYDILDIVVGSIIAIFAAFLLFTIVYMGVCMQVQKECLEAGYPAYAVAYNLDGYCMNLEGTVTVNVEKLQ